MCCSIRLTPSHSSSYTPEFVAPPPDQLLVQPVDAGAFALDLLEMFLHLLPPLRLQHGRTQSEVGQTQSHLPEQICLSATLQLRAVFTVQR